jgi:hypothetical protein
MSEHGSLPASLDEAAPAQIVARTRQDNMSTVTIYGEFTEPHRRLLERIDTIQATVDFVKMSGTCFTGRQQSSTSTSRTNVSFTKFLLNIQACTSRVLLACPAQTHAQEHADNIFRELLPGEDAPEFVTLFNQLVFSILVNCCDEEALQIVLRFKNDQTSPSISKRDGRRALFALMQTYEPVSTNAGNNAKTKLENFRFTLDKTMVHTQITDFHILVQGLEASRAMKLQPNELWASVNSAIKGTPFTIFRLPISMQHEFKTQNSHWLIDQIREFILAIEDDHDSQQTSEGRKKATLNAAKSDSSENSTTAELAAVVSKLAATVAAISTTKETAHRVPYKGKSAHTGTDTRPWVNTMGPCRFCSGSHRHRDCTKLKTDEPKPSIPPRAGAVRSMVTDDKGFLLGVIAKDQPPDECPTSSFSTVVYLLAIFTSLLWFVVAYIVIASRGNITFQRDLRIGVCRSGTGTLANASDTFCNFGVDSCASDHICDDMSKFSEIDFNKSKTFEVVNADDITSSGVGTVTLNVATTSGITKELVLKDVHYMPQQRMSLISVGKAMNSQGFESPDLKKLTWKVDRNCTMKLLKTSNTYQLDASVKYYSWTNSGVNVDRSGAQH